METAAIVCIIAVLLLYAAFYGALQIYRSLQRPPQKIPAVRVREEEPAPGAIDAVSLDIEYSPPGMASTITVAVGGDETQLHAFDVGPLSINDSQAWRWDVPSGWGQSTVISDTIRPLPAEARPESEPEPEKTLYDHLNEEW